MIVQSMWGICGPSARFVDEGIEFPEQVGEWAFPQCPECMGVKNPGGTMKFCAKYFRVYDIVITTGEEMDNKAIAATAVEREKEIPAKIAEIEKLAAENTALIEKLDAGLSSVTQGLPDAPSAGRPVLDSLTPFGGQLNGLDESLYRNNRTLESILDRLEI